VSIDPWYISRIMSVAPVQRQSLISLISIISLTVIGFLSTIYFAHALGPAPLGAYFLFLAYYGIFNLIGDGGFGGAAIKRISEGNEQNEFFSAFVFLRVVLIAVSVPVLLVAAQFLAELSSSGMFFWLLLALVISVFSGTTSAGVYGAGKVSVFQVSTFFDAFFRSIFQIGAVFLGFSSAGLAGGFVAGIVAAGAVNYRYLELHLVRFKTSHLRKLFGFSFWIFLTTSGSLVFNYADTILIGYFMGYADVGIYRTVFQLTAVATFTTLALHTVLYPKISKWNADGNRHAIETALARAFTYSLIIAIPICIGGWMFGERMLYFLYGESFVVGAPAFYILLLVQIVNVFMYLGTMCLNGLDKPRLAFWVTAFAAFANIVLNIILIPVIGIIGAALATLITMTLNAGIALYFLSKLISVKLEHNPVKNILISSVVMGLLMLIIHTVFPMSHVVWLFCAITAGAVVYFFVLLKLDNEIRDEIKGIGESLGLPWPRFL
jgi:O-antigen/teichoic acid export membrane protein